MININYWNKRIEKGFFSYEGLSSEERGNKEVIMFLLENNMITFNKIFKKFQKEKDVVLSSLKGNVYSINYVDKQFLKDKDIVMSIIKYIDIFNHIPNELLNDEDVLKLAITNKSFRISSLNEDNKKRKSIIFPFLVRDFYNFTYINDELRKDVSFVESVLEEIEKNKNSSKNISIKYLDESLKNNIELSKRILLLCPYDYENHIEEVKNNKNLILSVVKNNKNCGAIRLNEKLMDDDDIVFELIKNDGFALTKASKRIQENREFVKSAVENFLSLENIIVEDFKNDKEIVEVALKRNLGEFKYAGSKIKDDKDVAMRCVLHHSSMYEFVSDRLKNDLELTKIALQKNKYLAVFVGDSVLKNRIFVKQMLDIFIDLKIDPLFNKDVEILKKSIKLNIKNLSYVDKNLKEKKSFNLELLMHGIDIFRFISNDLKNDKSILYAHVEKFNYTLEELNLKNRRDLDLIVDCIAINSFVFIPSVIIRSEEKVFQLIEKLLERKNDITIKNDLVNQLIKNKEVFQIYKNSRNNTNSLEKTLENMLLLKEKNYLDSLVVKSSNNNKKLKF